MAFLCDACEQRAADPQRSFRVWETLDPEESSVCIGYCSKACESSDDRPWAPELCSACQREIRIHVPTLDVRDPASCNFCTDPNGNLICRNCAGTRLGYDRPLTPQDLLPEGWDWLI